MTDKQFHKPLSAEKAMRRKRRRQQGDEMAAEQSNAAPSFAQHTVDPLNILQLQRTIGNAAVIQMFRPPTVNDEAEAPDMENAISLSWLHDLLPTMTTIEVQALLNSFTNPAVNGYVQLAIPGYSFGLPYYGLLDAYGVVKEHLIKALMQDLANDRAPVVEQMDNASEDSERRTLMEQLRGLDTPALARLRPLTEKRANRWAHPDPAVQDAVLAALQLGAVFNAEAYLDDQKKAKEDSQGMFGMPEADWCGMFAAKNYATEGLDTDLRAGFLHVDNVEDYFTYRFNRNPGRIKKWIYADDVWHKLKDYHESRDSERQWLDAQRIYDFTNLDIRPGDIVLIDHSGGASADHIVTVQSYNPNTGALFTIGGNDGGYVVDNAPKKEADAGSKEKRMEDATGRNLKRGGAGGHVGMGMYDLSDQPDPSTLDKGKKKTRVYGIGRPSIVDFENHFYDKSTSEKPPTKEPQEI
jgi:hypothetical protein